jgi:hypothetical protein
MICFELRYRTSDLVTALVPADELRLAYHGTLADTSNPR